MNLTVIAVEPQVNCTLNIDNTNILVLCNYNRWN